MISHSARGTRRQSLRAFLMSLGALAALGALAGCSPQAQLPPLSTRDEHVSPDALLVPGDRQWVDTGIDVVAGRPLTIVGKGRVRIGKLRIKRHDDAELDVGPEGTFFYSDTLSHAEFPLAAAGNGPAPCFCLIGRIGHGPAFYIGPERSWVPEQSGRLWLGINDFDAAANTGEFFAEVSHPADVQPIAYREEVPLSAQGGSPLPDCSVVVFYIDGLRPDVVEEMAAMGHIPNLRGIFVEGGTYMSNAFTAFPSDTITSNGTMWTGCFSDRHGLKGQVRFSRVRLKSESYLETVGPSRSSRHLGPKGLDKLFHDAHAASIGLFRGAKDEEAWRQSQTSGTPALYDYLRERGDDWATGILPIMTEMPPLLWTRSMARVLPYFRAQEAWRYIDDANADFAVRHLIRQYRPVTIIWMPETDSVSHKECRGQFGSTRRTIARADRLVGEVVAELEAQGRIDSTYLMLVSDHGHLGGRNEHLSRFDLADEFFFCPRQMTRDGRWVGGGLGLSVRQHRSANWHKGDKAGQFVFLDADSDGTARIFLPKGEYRSGAWIGGSSAAELLSYRIAPHLAPINLPETLANAAAVHDDGRQGKPIDLVLMKLDDDSILITTCDRGQAIVQRKRNEAGAFLYRYAPVQEVSAAGEGVVCCDVASPKIDPLGLLKRVRASFLEEFHDEQTWLWVTATSDYPDGVVALTRHMLWQEPLKEQEREFAPDLVVTARRGWLFSTQNTPGTTHGYPLAESARATWYIAGPNIRCGARVDAPCRLADLTPTLLELTGTSYDPAQVDGHALRNIFQNADGEDGIRQAGGAQAPIHERPVYWQDVDLRAWQPLSYTPSDGYGHMPLSMNQPGSGWDINNITYNAISISDWSIFRLMDDILSPFTPARTKIDPAVNSADRSAARSRRLWVGDGVRALNVPQVTLSDYSPTSIGNMKRVDHAVDWLQERGTRLDDKLAAKVHRPTVLGAPAANKVIDSVQRGFWETYLWVQRVGVEILDEGILNGIENGVDSTMNAFRCPPAEQIVD